MDLASPSGLVSIDLIKHIELTRNRFGGSFWSILKSAIPSRVIKEEKLLTTIPNDKRIIKYESTALRDLIGRADYGFLDGKVRIKWGINFPITVDPDHFLLELIKVRSQAGQILYLSQMRKTLIGCPYL